MLNISTIHPDVALRDLLRGRIFVGKPGAGGDPGSGSGSGSGGDYDALAVYGDWERPTNELPTDFISIFLNGDISGVSMDTPFAKGYLVVSLYCKLNDDGSIKKNRIDRIIKQFDSLIEQCNAGCFHYEYDTQRFITPSTPNLSSGYSTTSLNLRWTTTRDFNK